MSRLRPRSFSAPALLGRLALASAAAVGFGGCAEDQIDLDPEVAATTAAEEAPEEPLLEMDERPVIEPDVRPKPISGGTLTIVTGDIAVASDPDRDVVFVVDVGDPVTGEGARLRHTIALQPGEEPGRVVEGAEGRVFVVLRGRGAIAELDLERGSVTARHPVCAMPRGLAYEPPLGRESGHLWVACVDGTIAKLRESTGELLARNLLRELPPAERGDAAAPVELINDLRDIVVLDHEIFVSTFRSATVIRTDGVYALQGFRPTAGAHVAWRMRPTGDGRIMLLHQVHSSLPILLATPTAPAEDQTRDDSDFRSYTGNGGCALVEPAITVIDPRPAPPLGAEEEFEVMVTDGLSTLGITVDALVSGPLNDRRDVLAVPGAPAHLEPPTNPGDCVPPPTPIAVPQDDEPQPQFISVDVTSAGRVVFQSREPAALVWFRNIRGALSRLELPLSAVSAYDTGHELFHRSTPSGVSCASCHPEGGDDGHIWHFEPIGRRRTQPLDVGLAGSEPFHWDGDLPDLPALLDEVMVARMESRPQSPARSDSMARWVLALQAPALGDEMFASSLVARGEALFDQFDCASCHAGPRLGGMPARGEGPFANTEIPSLRQVALHGPYMHDGRHRSLDAAAREMVFRTTPNPTIPEEDLQALVAYLQTL